MVPAGENDEQAGAVETEQAVDVGAPLPVPPGAEVLENSLPLRQPPTEAAGVLVGETADVIEPEHVGSVSEVLPSTTADDTVPVLLESPHEPAAPPVESMEGVVTLEQGESSSSAEPAPPAPAPAPTTISAPPPAVRVLPRRPRLRASFHYDHEDAINVELTLMDERRDLIYRTHIKPVPGSTIARIFEALVGVVAHAAAQAGVFGTRG